MNLVSRVREKNILRIGQKLHKFTNNSMRNREAPPFFKTMLTL